MHVLGTKWHKSVRKMRGNRMIFLAKKVYTRTREQKMGNFLRINFWKIH
jgi:hypothetical protein